MGAEIPVKSSSELHVCLIGELSGHVRQRALLTKRLGHQMSMVTFHPNPDPDVPVLPYKVPKINGLLGRVFETPLRLCRLSALLRKADADVYHLHYAYGDLAWLALLSGCRPLIVSTMGGDILFGEQNSASWAARKLTTLLLHSADIVTAKSDFLTRQIIKLGVAPEKIIRLTWGVDVGGLNAATSTVRQQLGLSERAKVLFIPRALRRLYNAHLVIEALPEVLKRFPDAILLIPEFAPEPGYREELMRRSAELGLEKAVRFIPPLTPQTIAAYYKASDVIMQIPSSDGLPQSILEAMACGVINLVSDNPAYAEVITDGVTGRVTPLDSAVIADRLIEILAGDSAVRHIERNAYELVLGHYDQAKELERLDATYRSLTDLSKPLRHPLWIRGAAFLLHALEVVGRYGAVHRLLSAVKCC